MYILWPICYRSMEMPKAVNKNRNKSTIATCLTIDMLNINYSDGHQLFLDYCSQQVVIATFYLTTWKGTQNYYSQL